MNKSPRYFTCNDVRNLKEPCANLTPRGTCYALTDRVRPTCTFYKRKSQWIKELELLDPLGLYSNKNREA